MLPELPSKAYISTRYFAQRAQDSLLHLPHPIRRKEAPTLKVCINAAQSNRVLYEINFSSASTIPSLPA